MTDQELDRLLYAHAGAARDLVLAQLPPISLKKKEEDLSAES